MPDLERLGHVQRDVSVNTSVSQARLLSLRRARRADAEALHELSAPFVALGRLRHRDVGEFVRRHADFLVVEDDSRIVACAGIQRFGNDWVLDNLCVQSSFQGRRTGSLLLDRILQEAARSAARALYAASSPTNAWFLGHGFVEVEPAAAPRRWVSQLDPTRNSVVYRRRI
ncbi:GNAT family N-acetyltransferase [Micromonospora sp. bgisy143]|uniref:GNAT family N-acetyltransferase n=1 Tax=Micromonospora sp. bgisy143 TaxID=3413790 RepID=UPI003EC0632D